MPVAVKFKQHEEIADMEGLTTSDLRELYEERWNIPPDADAVINGREVNEDRVLRDGDRVEFLYSETMW